MARVLAVGGVRFVLAGVLVAALAACFVGRAEAASVFSSPFASPAVFANSAASAASVVVGDRALTLKWSAVKGAAGYRVSWRGRVLKGGKPTAAWSAKWLGLKVLTASARSYKATGLVNGAQYQLRLEANTKAKKSAWVVKSTLVGSPKAPVPAATVPGAPTGVSGVAGDGQVVVSWLAPSSDGGSAITGYKVIASGGGSRTCATGGSLSCTVTGLTNGAGYSFTVTATNARGDSVASDLADVVVPFGVPGAPTSVEAAVGDASVAVSWSAPSSNGGSAVTGYKVIASSGGSPITKACATSPCTATGLTNGVAYTFTVKATNARGDSLASVAPAAVTPFGLLEAPTSVGAEVGDSSVAVSWSAPSSDGGSAVTGYTVTASGGGGSQTCTTATLSCTVTGLTNGTPYTFTVKATNARGDSLASATSDAVTPGSWNVGDVGPGGGKVFYAPSGTFTETGAACGSSCRYLEAAPADWNGVVGSGDPQLKWGGGDGTEGQCSNKNIADASGTAIGSGMQNTFAIMAACPSTDPSDPQSAPAAFAAANYTPAVNGTVVHGWFLPSRYELKQLDDSAVGEFAPSSDCWSSSQWDGRDGLYYLVAYSPTGDNYGNAPKHIDKGVRPVRAF